MIRRRPPAVVIRLRRVRLVIRRRPPAVVIRLRRVRRVIPRPQLLVIRRRPPAWIRRPRVRVVIRLRRVRLVIRVRRVLLVIRRRRPPVLIRLRRVWRVIRRRPPPVLIRLRRVRLVTQRRRPPVAIQLRRVRRVIPRRRPPALIRARPPAPIRFQPAWMIPPAQLAISRRASRPTPRPGRPLSAVIPRQHGQPTARQVPEMAPRRQLPPQRPPSRHSTCRQAPSRPALPPSPFVPWWAAPSILRPRCRANPTLAMSRLLLTCRPRMLASRRRRAAARRRPTATPGPTAGSPGGESDAATTEAPRSYANAKGEAGEVHVGDQLRSSNLQVAGEHVRYPYCRRPDHGSGLRRAR